MNLETKKVEPPHELILFAIENTADAMFLVDASGGIIHANTAASKYAGGLAQEDLLGRKVYDFNPGSTAEQWGAVWQKLSREKVVNFEAIFYLKDGSEKPVDLSMNHLEFEGEEYASAICRDISARVRAEQALRASETKFRTLVEGSVQGILVHGGDFRVNFANEAIARMFGYPNADAILGIDWLENAILEEERDESIERFRTVTGGRSILNPIEAQVIRKDGSPIWVECIYTCIDWQGERALLITATDISERKKAQDELVEALTQVRKLKDRLEMENVYLQDEIKHVHGFDYILTRSNLFLKELKKVEQVAATDATVLIMGETGSGKELIARAVHDSSGRDSRPLVKVNCAALPATLIESELFGHEKGAFTGAIARKIGRFEMADGGTIFLDEIGDLPLELQAKLLRVLQEGEFERLGNPSTIIVDVRVIAATNRNLEREIEEGRFREDLFYRLNVFPIQPPPLRDRREDIPLLVSHFVDKYSSKTGVKIETIPKNMLESLQNYDWPGNIRELENIIERAVIVSGDEELSLGDWLPKSSLPSKDKKIPTLDQREREHILEALRLTDGRVSGDRGAALLLGIKPTTLDARMKKLGISRNRSQ